SASGRPALSSAGAPGIGPVWRSSPMSPGRRDGLNLEPPMSDFKFACPTCGQHIAGDESWAGRQIKCPACQAAMMVPQLEAPPAPAAPPPPTPVRLSIAPTPAPPPGPAPSVPGAPKPPVPQMPMPSIPTGAGPGAKPYVPSYLRAEEKRGKGRAILTVAIVVVVLVAVAFVVAPMINSAQENLNKSRKKDAADSGGGEVGHMMELNRVLDETDPTRFERFAGEKPDKILPPPPYTLDVATAAIPSGNVRGKISNVRFTLQEAYLDVTGSTYVLTLREGVNVVADREIVLSFRLKPG